MDDAWKQLKAYADEQDEAAFGALVHEHLGLVYSAAQRQLENAASAEEVTQSVFILLAQKAKILRPTGSLAGWLYKTACLKAKKHRHQELARRRREATAHDMKITDPTEDSELDWDRVGPLLDEAMGSLSEADRNAVLMRYFQKRPLRDVGDSLGVSEEAARKRVNRSVERLRVWFHKHGVTCSALALGTTLSTHSVQAVPTTLTVSSIQAALAQATLTTSTTTSIITIMASSKGLFTAALLLGTMLPISLPYLRGTAKTDASLTEISTIPEILLTIPDARASGLIAEWEALMANYGPAGGSLAEVYEAIKETNDDFRRRTFRGALITEWVNRDPHEALNYLRANDSGRVTDCLTEWLHADPPGATAAMIDNPSGIESVIGSLLGKIAEIQPEAVPTLAKFVKKKSSWTHHVRDAFASLASSDRASALVQAEAMEGPQRAEALAGVAKGWAKVSGSEALEWATGLDDNTEGKGWILRSLLVGWAETDAGAALDHLSVAPPGGNDGEFANNTGGQVLKAAAAADFEGTLEWMGKNPGKLGREALGGLSRAVGKRLRTDTATMLEVIRDHPASADLMPALNSQIMNDGYAEKDAIWKWLGEQSHSEMVHDTRMQLLHTASRKDPELAMAWLEETGERLSARENAQVISSMLSQWSNFASIESLIDAAPESIREELIMQAFHRLPSNDVSTLDVWKDRIDELPAGKQGQASASIANRLADVDPQQAIAWADSLASTEQSVQALSAAVTRWAGADSYECSHWISSLPEGIRRDHATQAMINTIAKAEPDSAWAWAKTIDNPGLRAKSLKMAFTMMESRDAQAARTWLEDSSLTDADIQTLSH